MKESESPKLNAALVMGKYFSQEWMMVCFMEAEYRERSTFDRKFILF